MGIRHLSGNSAIDPNPDPLNFRILSEVRHECWLLALVKYNSSNFEGLKVLVFRDLETLKGLKSLDPHFFPESKLVARFVPTPDGVLMAIKFMKAMSDS